MLYYNKTVPDSIKSLDSSPNGLSMTVAEARLEQYGKNALLVKSEPLWRKAIEPFRSIFIAVLLIAASISLVKQQYLDAVIVLVIILINACIYYVQRFSTDKILRTLNKHEVQSVDCLRDGTIVTISEELLVLGDIIILSEGDKVPADARVISSVNALVDESLLTGESLPISKQAESISGTKPLYEQINTVFKGTSIVSGQVKAIVFATGNQTEYGLLASLTSQTKESKSLVQNKIDKLISKIIILILAVSLTILLLSAFRGIDLTQSLQFVMALAVAAVPEGLPVAITVVLVLGMRRMALKKALVRNMSSIESIGAVTVIATDKTGTLTHNKLSIQELWQPESSRIPIGHVVRHAVVHTGSNHHDPLDIAMSNYADAERIVQIQGAPVASLPFDQNYYMSGSVWHHKNNYFLNVKGAPEHILNRSTMTESEREAAHRELTRLTSMGYRVIAVATKTLNKTISQFVELKSGDKLTFVGFIAVADTLRPEAASAIKLAQQAGINVIMITGDHFETSFQIGKQLGLVKSREEVFDSRNMHKLTDAELLNLVQNTKIFSRVVPENKYRILSILKQNNITAMTGDGVNDVPALKNASVGIAMGSGSQIAKDASDIILIDNNFKSIVDAIKQGRLILSNIKRIITYLLATNTGLIITMLGSLIIGIPLPLLPIQILWINLITDTVLVIPLGLEPAEQDLMNQKPSPSNAPIITKSMLARMVIVSSAMGIVGLAIYIYFLTNYDYAYAQTITFSALVVMQWANAINSRSDYRSILSKLKILNKPFAVGLFVAILLQILALIGPLQGILGITGVDVFNLLTSSALAFVAIILVTEIHKFIGRSKALSSNRP